MIDDRSILILGTERILRERDRDARDVDNPCPIAPAAAVIFGRWTTDVLWVLLNEGRMRFSKPKQRIPNATPKVLTQLWVPKCVLNVEVSLPS